jgi:hypothetical protein
MKKQIRKLSPWAKMLQAAKRKTSLRLTASEVQTFVYLRKPKD